MSDKHVFDSDHVGPSLEVSEMLVDIAAVLHQFESPNRLQGIGGKLSIDTSAYRRSHADGFTPD
ncbi:hypothetical protein [Candidatus Poriferisodalis sp.]|uniref:hypothetical protein n=1 Tax=Candidatus Poriferisodalis sp. TaxID=3101277 RepID=UPI003B520931